MPGETIHFSALPTIEHGGRVWDFDHWTASRFDQDGSDAYAFDLQATTAVNGGAWNGPAAVSPPTELTIVPYDRYELAAIYELRRVPTEGYNTMLEDSVYWAVDVLTDYLWPPPPQPPRPLP